MPRGAKSCIALQENLKALDAAVHQALHRADPLA
jgi:hypothetical protein